MGQLARSAMSERRRVLMLTYSATEDDPRVMLEATSLSGMGYDVSVIGVAMGRPPSVATLRGFNLTLVPLVNCRNPIVLARALLVLVRGRVEKGTADSVRSSMTGLLFFNLWALRIGWRNDANVIHCHEHQPLPAAWLLSRLRRAKLVYDAHENTSLNRAAYGLQGQLSIRLEKLLLPRMDAVITVGERLADFLRRRGARRVEVVGNWKKASDYRADKRTVAALRKELAIPREALVVGYLGQLDPIRDLEPLLDAVAKTAGVHLVIGGRGALTETVVNAAQHHPNIHWLGWVPLEKVPAYTQLADVIYTSLNASGPQADFVAPNKLFDAFVAGKPVIARKGIGEIGEILDRLPAGIQLEDVTVDSIGESLDQLRDPALRARLGQAALQGAAEFNADVATNRLRDLYADLIPA
jgi:glycosyltransferase involved in cell wall biosynthesis